jgi:hypothetical protein
VKKRPRRYLTKAQLVELLDDQASGDLADVFGPSRRRRLNAAALADLPDTARLPTRMVAVIIDGEGARYVKVRALMPGADSVLLYMTCEAYLGLPEF